MLDNNVQFSLTTDLCTVRDDGKHLFLVWFSLVYWGLTPQQQPGSYQVSEMTMMKSVFWWRKPEYPEETTDLRQVFLSLQLLIEAC